MTPAGTEARDRRSLRAAWVCLCLVLVGTAYLRSRLFDIPLERDEGEYAYIGQRLLAGEAPYAGAYTLKWPGTHAMYAASMALFGESLRGIRLGLLLVNAATIALVFRLARRHAGPWSGAAAALTYAALSTHSAVLGQAAHATHFVVFFALAALAVTPRDTASAPAWRHVLAGVLLGCAVLMKQTGLFLAAFGMALPLLRATGSRAERWRGAGLCSLGGLLPIAATFGLLAAVGTFERFWFWTVTYAREYAATTTSGAAALANLGRAGEVVLAPAWPLWALGGAGLVLAMLDPARTRSRSWLLGLLLASLLALLPGLQFRRHYFVLLLPIVAILSGVGLASVARRVPGRAGAIVAALLLLVATGATMFGDRDFLWLNSPLETSRALYGPNPFPEAEWIAAEIAARSGPDDELVVFGSEPEIPFLARRRSATGFLYVYGLMEAHPFASEMQRDMIAEVEAAAPAFAVYVKTPSSWLEREDSDPHVLEWMRGWLDANYVWIGAVEVFSAADTRSYWDEQTLEYKPHSPNYCLVFRRREGR